ncbi:MAG TPA: hypothetical protein VM262_12520 [Acidimicrobiales bacterium]|nr:hypothetical protein [Acidimicrobiales bacterium]
MAAAAAVALVLLSEGHLLVLGVFVAVIAATPAGAATAFLATTAVLLRWGSPSLAAVGGGQAVLGPALVVGDTVAAGSAVLAALAIALLAPRPVVLALALGVVAGAVAVGPEIPHDLGIRIVGAAAGAAVAVGARWLPARQPAAAALAALALVAAA